MKASEAKEEWLKEKPYGRQNGKDFWQTVYKALDLLEKQEQGLLIELPVPLGTEVWSYEDIWSGDGDHIEKTVIVNAPVEIDLLYNSENWGVTVFATKEEAEKRLEELRNDSK